VSALRIGYVTAAAPYRKAVSKHDLAGIISGCTDYFAATRKLFSAKPLDLRENK
jgi:hypothetical protein